MTHTDPIGVARVVLRKLACEVPVDPYDAAARHGIEIVERDLEESVSGMLVWRGNRAVIGVNRRHHPNRRRFTVAHELGHYLLHRELASVFVDGPGVLYRDLSSSEDSRQQEIDANRFAAEFLLPEAAVRECLGEQSVDAHDEITIRALAERFRVSPQALTIRLTRLGLITG